MSGFCGIVNFNKKPIEIEEIESMLQQIEITAVDCSELWLKANLAFGHKLNYFTPESFYEKLPFYDSLKGIAITADTRIDNREDLANSLGVQLSVKCPTPDSQLIMMAYQKWGIEYASHLIGNYSIVIWDENQQQIILTTDHFGHYPIYYHINNEQFIFASELKSINSKVKKGVNLNKIIDFLVLENFYGDKESTHLKDVLKVEPATTLMVSKNGIKKLIHWKPDPTKRLPYKKESDLVEAFQEVMFQSVGDRIRTNFPVAAMLSGGLDSSSINAVAAKILEKQNRELIALAGVLPESSKPDFTDERAYIEQFKSFKNINIQYVTAEGLGPFSGVKAKLARTLSPNFSNRHFMYDAISEVANRHHAKVLLDGIYGEIGPSFHGKSYWANLFKNKQFSHLGKELRALGKELNYSPLLLFGSKVIRPLLKENNFLRKKSKFEGQLSAFHNHFPLKQSFIDRHIGKESNYLLRQSAAYIHQGSSSMRQQQMLSILRSQGSGWPYMDDNHTQHATPFSDRRLIEFALAAPANFKVKNGWSRYMIRAGMEGLLPKSIQWRRTKAPFVPDFAFRYNRQREEVQKSLTDAKPSKLISEIFDLPKMIQFLSNDLPIPINKQSKIPDKILEANLANTLAVYLFYFIKDVE